MESKLNIGRFCSNRLRRKLGTRVAQRFGVYGWNIGISYILGIVNIDIKWKYLSFILNLEHMCCSGCSNFGRWIPCIYPLDDPEELMAFNNLSKTSCIYLVQALRIDWKEVCTKIFHIVDIKNRSTAQNFISHDILSPDCYKLLVIHPVIHKIYISFIYRQSWSH